MVSATRNQLSDEIDNVYDDCPPNEAPDLLFTFSYFTFKEIHPEAFDVFINFAPSDLQRLRVEQRHKMPREFFPGLENAPQSQQSLLIGIYQGVQETANIDDVREQIFGVWEELEREERSQEEIYNAITKSLSRWKVRTT